eukprot:gene7808-15974_t
MKRSIIPHGFELTSHAIFKEYVPPLAPPVDICPRSYDSHESDAEAPKNFKATHNSINIKCNPKFDGTGTDLQCPVCLSHISDPATIVDCRHIFCMSCILIWFRTKVQCPLCKTNSKHFLSTKICANQDNKMQLWSVDGSGLEKIEPTNLALALAVHKKIIHQFDDRPVKKVRMNTIISNESILSNITTSTSKQINDQLDTMEYNTPSYIMPSMSSTSNNNNNNNDDFDLIELELQQAFIDLRQV